MESHTIFVSSENRDLSLYPSGNNYVLSLVTPVREVTSVELLHASVPNSLYNLNDGTGVFSVSNVSSNNATQVLGDLSTFSLPQGFYGATGLASYMADASSNVCGISVSYLQNEGKFLFTRPTAYGPFGLYSNTQEMTRMMGFDDTTTQTVLMSSNVGFAGPQDFPLYSDFLLTRGREFIKSEKVVNLAPNEGVFLDIDELRTNFTQDAGPGSSNRAFGIIPMDVASGQIKRFKQMTDYNMQVNFPVPIPQVDRLTVRWTNRYGQLISFNGLEDNSFAIKLHTRRVNACP
jgi:hypothetical protein